MPSEREIAAGERAARQAAPGMGPFAGRVNAVAVLEAAEEVRTGQLRPEPPKEPAAEQ
jgi:hypothetical protein